MTHYIDPHPGWIRERTYELHQGGLSYDAARKQAEAEAEADDKFGAEENGVDQRCLTAHHEVGHAVAAVMRGGGVLTSITIEPTSEHLGKTWSRIKPYDAPVSATAMQGRGSPRGVASGTPSAISCCVVQRRV
jgi:hypothetical protein